MEPIIAHEFTSEDYTIYTEKDAYEVLDEIEELSKEYQPDMIIYRVISSAF